ncbi:putative F-box/FBD/LRR-repeat protein At5g56810 isoform X2 [Vicia villosa]|uniref:putative F-box/FBD/LRR-repeat protein At5g56810 isoform X2 n=1 Tax=Vicia villosa TaxID=3911 RepID=UPI00273AD30F|nr:putative F-box/FBD/LRR-repeat protein At5g56810 isoform X2 [Vicia villosa]
MERKETESTRPTVIDAETDIISDLPVHMIGEILSYLSIREAVRTSVLSKRWRNNWHTLPNLVFDFQCLPAVASQHPIVFCKYLIADDVPIKLSTPCINLRSLTLFINFDDLNQILAALCLLRSSPNLQTLEIFATMKEQTALLTAGSFCWGDIFSVPATPLSMQHVTINFISGFKSEIYFIRFLLQYSHVLEKMIVKPLVNVRPGLVRGLVRFRRGSPKAGVFYIDQDQS